MQQKYDVAMYVKPCSKFWTYAELEKLVHTLNSNHQGSSIHPINIKDKDGDRWAVGIITANAAQTLQNKYEQESEIGQFISSKIDGLDKEGKYTFDFKGIRIFMNAA